MAKFAFIVGVLSGLIGIFVWLSGIPDLKTLVYGTDEALKQDRYLMAELEKERKSVISTKPCDSSDHLCAAGVLVNQQGKEVSLSLDSSVRLIAFGSTVLGCRHLAENVDILVRAVAKIIPVKGYYIAVDTRVDTPERLREFRTQLDFQIDFLTGTDEQLKAAAKSLRVFYQKGVNRDGSPFLDHTALIYIVDAQGYVLGWISRDAPLPKAAESLLKAMLSANRKDPVLIKASTAQIPSTLATVEIPREQVLKALLESDYAGLKDSVRSMEKERRIKPCHG